jgi:hypothetical protein
MYIYLYCTKWCKNRIQIFYKYLNEMLLYTLKDYEKNQTQYNVLTTFLKKKRYTKKKAEGTKTW